MKKKKTAVLTLPKTTTTETSPVITAITNTSTTTVKPQKKKKNPDIVPLFLSFSVLLPDSENQHRLQKKIDFLEIVLGGPRTHTNLYSGLAEVSIL